MVEPVGVTVRDLDAALKLGKPKDRAMVSVEDGRVTIGAASIPTVEVEVPEYPEAGRYCVGKYSGAEMVEVAEFASPDDMRPVLTGIRLEAGRVIATDSYRLAVLEVEGQGPDDGITIPAKPVAALGKRCEILTVSHEGNYVEVAGAIKATGARIVWKGRRIEGQYPKVDNIFPDSWEIEATLSGDAGEVLKAYAGMAAKGGRVRVTLNGAVEVDYISQDGVEAAGARIGGEVSGLGDEPMVLGANPVFLGSAARFGGEGATFRAISPLRPMLIESERRRAFVMPIRLDD